MFLSLTSPSMCHRRLLKKDNEIINMTAVRCQCTMPFHAFIFCKQEVIMEKATGVSLEGDWWAVEFDIFPDAAVINFVVKYYEHFDNNERQDFKALVELDAVGG